MTPHMLRGIARAAFAVALILGAIWLLEALGVVDLIDHPGIGAIGFALLAFFCNYLAGKGNRPE